MHYFIIREHEHPRHFIWTRQVLSNVTGLLGRGTEIRDERCAKRRGCAAHYRITQNIESKITISTHRDGNTRRYRNVVAKTSWIETILVVPMDFFHWKITRIWILHWSRGALHGQTHHTAIIIQHMDIQHIIVITCDSQHGDFDLPTSNCHTLACKAGLCIMRFFLYRLCLKTRILIKHILGLQEVSISTTTWKFIQHLITTEAYKWCHDDLAIQSSNMSMAKQLLWYRSTLK